MKTWNKMRKHGRGLLLGLALALMASTVQAQTFSTPLNLSNNAGTSLFPQVAVDSSGNINVVWQDNTPGNNDIFFSRSTNGGVSFSAVQNLSSDTGDSIDPQIAVDSSGNINVVWSDNTPGNYDIFFSRSTNGGTTFSAPQNLSNNAGASDVPHIAVDSSGNINVVWQDNTPGNFDIFFTRSTNGGTTFSAPLNLSNNTGLSEVPQIAVDSSGNINVVWDDNTPGNFDIFFTRSLGADLSGVKTASPNPVRAGSNLTFTITVNNGGPAPAESVVVMDPVPANTTFASLAFPAGWSCSAPPVGSTGTVNCTTASLADGASAVFTLVVTVGAAVPDGTVISNTATVSSSTPDPNPGNNSGSATATVSNPADLSLSLAGKPSPVKSKTNLTYTITIPNAGPGPAANVTMNDPLPNGTVFVSATTSQGSCTTPAVGAIGTLSCSLGTLAAGSSATETLVVKVTATGGSTLTNTASVSSSTPDPNTLDNSATLTTKVFGSRH